MLILPPYSRREDEQAAKQVKFTGKRNNLKEFITGFFKSPNGRQVFEVVVFARGH